MARNWEKRKKALSFNDEDISKLTCVQMSYDSPYSEMLKTLYRHYGVKVEEVAYKLNTDEIGFNDKQLEILGGLENPPPKKTAAYIVESLKKNDTPLTPDQEIRLRRNVRTLYTKATDQIIKADMVAMAGNSGDVPRGFYGEKPDKRVKENKNPTDIRAYIEKDIIFPTVLDRDLPAYGVCYGAQMPVVTGLGKSALKGTKLVPHLPDEPSVALSHSVPNYAGLGAERANAFLQKDYIGNLDGKAENPFVSTDAMHPVEIKENSIIHELVSSQFSHFHPTKNPYVDISSHHQAIRAETLPDGFMATALSPDDFTECTESTRLKNGEKTLSFGLFCQFHPETGAGLPQSDIEKARTDFRQAQGGGIAKAIAEAQIFTAMFKQRWQEAGHDLKDMPTYLEICKHEKNYYTQQKESKAKAGSLVDFVAARATKEKAAKNRILQSKFNVR